MATKADKKNAIRQEIIDSATIYSQNLAGKAFLYVYGEEFFEVSFPIDHFLHLTGVETNLSAKDFYKNAKKGKLTNNQFYFNARHPYANAKKKLPCLKRLPELTNDMVCILKDMQTLTIIYKLSVTNLEFTLGLTENIDNHGNKINDFFLPAVFHRQFCQSHGGREGIFLMAEPEIGDKSRMGVEERDSEEEEALRI